MHIYRVLMNKPEYSHPLPVAHYLNKADAKADCVNRNNVCKNQYATYHWDCVEAF